ncbi:DNA sulfur modification protein DndB [Paenibacillus roseipurpureus]|uniref:DNA sulfur modification protein DndB n=1 Tax=Paenibacillus roseopurpureus TaxID=2918901 RepID=A0AA96LNA3_9BACL|nr:DNA sulfur modification protein DndB [Paenibacillus sp. MBLB1832]WNR45137.1 DNA sulfur modification protein DndB [Paenibacillus sp. MBLB1832]
MNMNFSYNFPAIKGVQASKDFYTVICPLRLIPKIFLFDEEEIPAEHRAQRLMNKSRIPEITNYILENPKDYVFSSLTASVDGEMSFHPYSEEFKDIGRLTISLDSKFLINDGQHRRAAIEEALKISPELGDESISVVFFHDRGLLRSQQLFADLNRHAVNTTSSIGILYEHRDQLALVTKNLITEVPLLERYTDKEKVSLSKNSPKLFALNHIFNTNCRLLGKKKGELISDQEKQYIKEFWEIFCDSILEWGLVLKKEMSPRELRATSIAAHGVFLEAVGIVGYSLFSKYPTQWKSYLKQLSNIDWSRDNKSDWLGRAYGPTGRINKTNETVQLTANLIKVKLGLSLTDYELQMETRFMEGNRVGA